MGELKKTMLKSIKSKKLSKEYIKIFRVRTTSVGNIHFCLGRVCNFTLFADWFFFFLLFLDHSQFLVLFIHIGIIHARFSTRLQIMLSYKVNGPIACDKFERNPH